MLCIQFTKVTNSTVSKAFGNPEKEQHDHYLFFAVYCINTVIHYFNSMSYYAVVFSKNMTDAGK